MYKFNLLSRLRNLQTVNLSFWNSLNLVFSCRFLSLATFAEEHIEDEDAPVFLRFINLLINDAIYLLDEALGYMKQIQEQQIEQESWANLPPQERSQNESQLMHIGRLARYHNIMGTGMFYRTTIRKYTDRGNLNG